MPHVVLLAYTAAVPQKLLTKKARQGKDRIDKRLALGRRSESLSHGTVGFAVGYYIGASNVRLPPRRVAFRLRWDSLHVWYTRKNVTSNNKPKE